jgi:hypothetical protein
MIGKSSLPLAPICIDHARVQSIDNATLGDFATVDACGLVALPHSFV